MFRSLRLRLPIRRAGRVGVIPTLGAYFVSGFALAPPAGIAHDEAFLIAPMTSIVLWVVQFQSAGIAQHEAFLIALEARFVFGFALAPSTGIALEAFILMALTTSRAVFEVAQLQSLPAFRATGLPRLTTATCSGPITIRHQLHLPRFANSLIATARACCHYVLAAVFGSSLLSAAFWIPAFAGMTGVEIKRASD